MRRSERVRRHLNFEIYDRTGEKIYKKEGRSQDSDLPEEGRSQDRSQESGLPEEGRSQDRRSQDRSQDSGLPEEGGSQDRRSQDRSQESGLPEEGRSQDRSQERSQDRGLPEEGRSQDSGLPKVGRSQDRRSQNSGLPKVERGQDRRSQGSGLPKVERSEDSGPPKVRRGQVKMDADQLPALQVQIQTLNGDLADFLEEYDVNDMEPNIDDLDKASHRAEEFRSVLREKHRSVLMILGNDAYKQYYDDSLDRALQNIKEYILGVKGVKREIRRVANLRQANAEEGNENYFNFIRDELWAQLGVIEGDVSQIPEDFSDDELVVKKEKLVEIQKRLDHIWNRISEMMKLNINADVVKALSDKLREVAGEKEIYSELLKTEVLAREIKKKENFKRSKLNIKLAKFSGYESTNDIYTFQSEFEKIHVPDTPSDILPDLLKNNYLLDPALSLVKGVECMDDIWKRLKLAYGNPKILLQRKMRELTKFDSSIQRSKDYQKVELWLSKIIALMKDLAKLAADHDIEGMLYNGDAIDKVLRVLGEGRVSRWLAKDCYHDEYDNDDEDDFETTNKESWASLMVYLEKELRILQRKALVFQSVPEGKDSVKKPEKPKPKEGFLAEVDSGSTEDDLSSHGSSSTSHHTHSDPPSCVLCGKTDHVTTPGPGSTQLVQYYACEEWAKMKTEDRFRTLREKKLCFQCLFPGADWNTGKHQDGKCQHEYVCKHPSHNKFKRKKHVLVCHEHRDTPQNEELLKKYKERCLPKNKPIPSFIKDIQIAFVNQTVSHASETSKEPRAIYLFQVIEVNSHRFLIFYDNGCKTFLVAHRAVQRLGSNAEVTSPPPVDIGGIGGQVTVAPYGVYKVKLNLHDGTPATFHGPCMEKITHTFPDYTIQGAVEKDIHRAYADAGGCVTDLPDLPKSIGGDVDFMIGIQYLRYYPRFLFQLPSGLTIYESQFKSVDGSRGVVGGPHELFSLMEQQFYQDEESGHLSMRSFLCDQAQLFYNGYQLNPDVGLLGYKESATLESYDVYKEKPAEHKEESYLSKSAELFDYTEKLGTEITFRCVDCRGCPRCKEGEGIEEISVQEEVEDDLIDKCVEVDTKERKSTFKMPLIKDPELHLAPNREEVLKIYYRVLKQLKTEANKKEIIAAEDKLQKLGKVQYVHKLPMKTQEMLKTSRVQNFIPWRPVWKDTSVSTPVRPVFDASHPTPSGESLNDCVAKGRNNLNSLQEIFLRWQTHPVAFHTDVQSMYPSVLLREEDWVLQRYLWQPELDPSKPPMEKVIMANIFGIKCSGNVAQKALRKTAEASKSDYPEVHDIVKNDTYMDDILSGAPTLQEVHQRADWMVLAMAKGDFGFKGFSISGRPPPENLSDDGESIFVAGQKWYTNEDELAYNMKQLNFAKKRRGRKPSDQDDIIPKKLTRKHCRSKVAEIFDLNGRLAPIIAGFKIDQRHMVSCKLGWEDALPDNLRAIWESHFEMMREIKNIRYKRAIVPDDAVGIEISTLDFGDASSEIACVAIYARFLRRNGQYSCQLILGRTRIIPDDTTQPRAELFAAMINAHSGEVVRRALSKVHTGHIKFSDSQIALQWIKSEARPQKLWVRNRAIETRRWTNVFDWRYIKSKNMLADIGTRRGCTLNDVAPDAPWIIGQPWMTDPCSQHALLTS